MVGFPGETPEQFEHTLELFRRVRFDQAFMFEYSDRPGTAAAELEPKIPRPEKNRRLRELAALQNTTSRELNSELVGQSFEVLVTGTSPKDASKLTGRTRQNKTMIFEGPSELIGGFAQVTARRPFLWGFTGELDG
jgi:tRNA-2-methylthio-N6-dimethylallyladenosine synthase